MPAPTPAALPRIRRALSFYRIAAWVTGGFLLLLLVEMILKYSPLHVEIFAGGSGGPLWLAPVIPGAGCEWYSLFVPGGMGCHIESTGDGVNISTIILIVHGWLYVAYLFSNFNLWSLLRWPFKRFILMALGGVVPLMSFFVEHVMTRIARADMARIAERAPARATSTPQPEESA